MSHMQDPTPPNWQNIELADTWPDSINLKTPSGWAQLLKGVFGKRRPVEVPEALQAEFHIPKYILQEFHNLPNGNYSRRFSRGYITGFDISMLGQVRHARAWIAGKLQSCQCVADVGTAGGKTAAAIQSAGVKDVWGIDPSPYLLRHAATDYPNIRFIQGTAESLPFDEKRLDGIAVCFVFHEIPPKQTELALKTFNRCLKQGGLVAISEPSERQLQPLRWRDLLSKKGWLQLYFGRLAHFVFEPFLMSWHKQNKQSLAESTGFTLKEANIDMPINTYLLEKTSDI